MKRREFMKSGAAFGAALAGTNLAQLAIPMSAEAIGTGGGIDIPEGLDMLARGKSRNTIPEIRPEILNNPNSVFLVKTDVDAARDGSGFFSEARPQLFDAGKSAIPRIFVKGTKKGGSTALRPNFTTVADDVANHTCGVITSPDFVAGFAQGLRELGNSNTIVTSRGGNVRSHRLTGIYDAFDKHGLSLIEAKYARFSDYGKKELNWARVPDPVLWKNIPMNRPIGDDDNLFINMPKLKCHNLGLTTLAIKNLQGVVPSGYGQFCTQWSALEYMCKESYRINFKRDFVKQYYQNIESAFLKHRAAGYRHWDYEKAYPAYEKKGGWEAFRKVKNNPEDLKEFMSDIPPNLMWDEIWCQRAIDCATAIKPDINIIEGIIGRDGSGFRTGRDELINVLVIGRSINRVDAVASYIMGQDPRELYYTRIGKERGLGECDPEKISINWLNDDGIVPVKSLKEIKRYRLGVTLHTRKSTADRLFW